MVQKAVLDYFCQENQTAFQNQRQTRCLFVSEPNLYPPAYSLNGTRIGQDFRILHHLLNAYKFKGYTFVGPDTAGGANQMFAE